MYNCDLSRKLRIHSMMKMMCVSVGGGVDSQIWMMMVSWVGLFIIIKRSYRHVLGIWEWPEGGRANFTFWHDAAVPNIQNYNCMQFLSATCYGKLNNKQTPINKSHQTSSSFLFRWTMDDFRLQWCLHQYTSNMPATELIKARDISELLNHEKCYITFNIIQ